MNFNRYAVAAIYRFEMARFRRTLWQSLAAPVITTSLYFVVFGAAIGTRMSEVEGVPYGAFIVPGLIMLALFTESLSNASFGIYLPRFTGTIFEVLSAPVSAFEMVFAYVGAAATKSILLGVVILATANLFVPVSIAHPAWMIVFPIAARMARHRSSVPGSPPTRMTSFPSVAGPFEPTTGASRNSARLVVTAPASLRDVAGDTVLMSTSTAPDLIPSTTPSDPSTTCSTSAGCDTIVMTISTSAATCAGPLPALAPSRSSGSILAAVRFQTVSGKPALATFAAIAAPIVPRPRNPIRSLMPT